MSKEMDEETKRRLIYVKKLYLHGHEHAPYGTEFDRMIAIHHFDNAIELLLKCVATKYDVPFKGLYITFPDLWSAVNQKCRLPKRTEMFQLHNLRSDVQHWGISPFSLEIINRFDVYTLDFIRALFKKIFELDFDELFTSSLIKDETMRKILTIAERAFGNKNYIKSMRFADAAFNRALRQQREDFGFYVPSEKRELLEEMVDIVSILTLGIDYREYSKYRKIAPLYTIWDEEEQNIGYPQPLFGTDTEENRYTRENALFCFNFVLECILRWRL